MRTSALTPTERGAEQRLVAGVEIVLRRIDPGHTRSDRRLDDPDGSVDVGVGAQLWTKLEPAEADAGHGHTALA
jgi:hypothetical protein